MPARRAPVFASSGGWSGRSRIWAIANDVRGAVDGWDFKQYVLGTLFYRFISENFASYIEAGDDSVRYSSIVASACGSTPNSFLLNPAAISFALPTSATLPLRLPST